MRRADTERDPHHEAVELRLGQRIRALELDRVLRREDDEGARSSWLWPSTVTRLLHALEQPRLRSRRRAVDLVDEHEMREDRAGPELEARVELVEDGGPDDVGGQQVRCALDARVVGVDRAREGAREGGLADAGRVLDRAWPPAMSAISTSRRTPSGTFTAAPMLAVTREPRAATS